MHCMQFFFLQIQDFQFIFMDRNFFTQARVQIIEHEPILTIVKF